MTQQRITFEWVLEEGRVDFWRIAEADTLERALRLHNAEQRIVLRVLRGLALFLVVIAVASGAGMTHSERERREAQKGIAFTLLLENEAWARRDRGLYESLIDPHLNDVWREEWRDYWRASAKNESDFKATLLQVHQVDGYMQATVLTHQPAFEWWQTSPYREVRFYRRVDQRWLRTVPPAALWGEVRQLQTDHLTFVYYERDAAAVEAVASKLEEAYIGMYHTLGLPDAPSERQVVAIIPQPIGRWSSTLPQYEVTSPLLARIPQGQSDSEYIAYEIMGWFTYRAMRDAAPNMAVRYLYRWPILIWGLRGWLRDDLLDQPSPWHEEAIEVLRHSAPKFLPIELNDITDLRTKARPTREDVILRYLSAESFMQYVVDTYGRQRLPDLLITMVQDSSWKDIIPHVYGHSVEEFEAGWNMHLIKEYELEDVMGK